MKFSKQEQNDEKFGIGKDKELALIFSYQGAVGGQCQVLIGKSVPSDANLFEEGIRAGEHVLANYSPLVISIARELYEKNTKCLDFEDLIGAGNEGLVLALHRFNPLMGCRFGTYAAWWIRNRISLAIRSARWIMRIPDRTYKQLLKVMKCIGLFTRRYGCVPSIPEISGLTKLSTEVVKRCLIWASHHELSLETPIGEDGQGTLGDLIEDRCGLSYQDAVDSLMRNQLIEAIGGVLRTLTPREEKVIRMRYGLDEDGEEGKLRGIGSSLALSAEAVRHIEAVAIRKLRQPSRARKLRPFTREAKGIA